MYSGDPKRPKNIIYYQQKVTPEEQSDFFQLISMIFGICSFLFKVNNHMFIYLYYRLNGRFG
jgi:hypothetical protein